jgi:hypothetical protein
VLQDVAVNDVHTRIANTQSPTSLTHCLTWNTSSTVTVDHCGVTQNGLVVLQSYLVSSRVKSSVATADIIVMAGMGMERVDIKSTSILD